MKHDVTARPKQSSLARLQQSLVFFWFVIVLGWVMWSAPRSAWLCLTGLLLLAGGHAIVLAAQLICRVLVGGDDARSKPRTTELLRAWRAETWLAVKVFAWQQPFRWRNCPDSTQPQAGRRAVVLVHGFVCNRGFWLPWMAELRRREVPCMAVNLEPVWGSIDDYVSIIDTAVQRAWQLTGQAPLLVGHSMGGLAIRAWLVSSQAAPSRIHRVITIGSPHAGTWLAHWSRMPNGMQMRPQGAWLATLAQREKEMRGEEAYASFVCWYANTDNIVFPVSTATLPGADNRLVRGAPHVGLAYEPRILADVIQHLED